MGTTYCSDALHLCQSDYISVTLGTVITNCDLFWQFPVVTDKCHGYDQATLTIHETTHIDGLVGLSDPSTVDFRNNYGWPAITYLSAEQAVTNADNYQYYANGKGSPPRHGDVHGRKDKVNRQNKNSPKLTILLRYSRLRWARMLIGSLQTLMIVDVIMLR